MRERFVLLVTALLLLSGCSGIQDRGDNTYQYFEIIEDGEWSLDDELFFSSSDLKSDRRYNVTLILRLDRGIRYQLIPIGVTFETPRRELKTSEIQVPIKRMQGGKGGFNIIEQATIIEQGVQYPDQGVYSYSLRHLSTDSVIKGVVEVGLLIEPTR